MVDENDLAAFLAGDGFSDAPADSWLYRENWLAWHSVMLTPGMLEREVARAVACDREPWVWESLRRLYNDCRKRGRTMPPSLQRWVDDIVNGERSRPTKPGPKPDSDMYSQYRIAYRVLRMTMPHDAALEYMADALSTDDKLVSTDTVRSRVRRGAGFAQ